MAKGQDSIEKAWAREWRRPACAITFDLRQRPQDWLKRNGADVANYAS
jgi:hypothetical protein